MVIRRRQHHRPRTFVTFWNFQLFKNSVFGIDKLLLRNTPAETKFCLSRSFEGLALNCTNHNALGEVLLYEGIYYQNGHGCDNGTRHLYSLVWGSTIHIVVIHNCLVDLGGQKDDGS